MDNRDKKVLILGYVNLLIVSKLNKIVGYEIFR